MTKKEELEDPQSTWNRTADDEQDAGLRADGIFLDFFDQGA